MSNVRCFDTAKEIIELAEERFAPRWKLNSERVDILKQYCDTIDEMAAEFDGISYDVEIDEITMNITIALECEEVTIKSSNHVLYELMKRTVQFGFATSEDGNLLVKFTFPNLWDRV